MPDFRQSTPTQAPPSRAPRPTALRTLRQINPFRRPRFLRGERLAAPAIAPVVTTERLTLRPHRLSDADAWFSLQSNEEVLRYLDWPQRTRRESRRHLWHRTRHTVLSQTDDFLALAIELDGRLVGDVSLHLREVKDGRRAVEAGWIIHPEYSGRGLATEAAGALITFAFDYLAATRVTAKIKPGNERSVALARRLGFVSADGTEQHMVLTRDRFDERPALAYLTDGTERITR